MSFSRIQSAGDRGSRNRDGTLAKAWRANPRCLVKRDMFTCALNMTLGTYRQKSFFQTKLVLEIGALCWLISSSRQASEGSMCSLKICSAKSISSELGTCHDTFKKLMSNAILPLKRQSNPHIDVIYFISLTPMVMVLLPKV